MGVEVGDFVPFFKAIDDNGQLFHSSSIIGVTPVVIYFYPKNFTPGCIKEACGFRDDYELFTSYGAEVIGISSDKVRSHARFKKRYKLPFVFYQMIKENYRDFLVCTQNYLDSYQVEKLM